MFIYTDDSPWFEEAGSNRGQKSEASLPCNILLPTDGARSNWFLFTWSSSSTSLVLANRARGLDFFLRDSTSCSAFSVSALGSTATEVLRLMGEVDLRGDRRGESRRGLDAARRNDEGEEGFSAASSSSSSSSSSLV
ncbi:hypothetical protein GUITHDRAFT_150345 [Guillardia theta CCMP2712]|uniref:Uncharacterized protein n=1 Tax=Guillardia theta (strain CCMP2712) TaxID=905079 RepID=L1JYB2_GUITC|nr:hypothetical protein GUITHDRAFT_150345 [Guillardia theta CCMP2712]EKX53210.1 hypothetical protein GUITHDRAFT_150345 [Guillardia theta CCMP2712]|eukprot:XP_005840190.1 hypothetical protein GUITHDRAFT_150345 [Guillardia theta CCMP2712]